MFTFTRRAILRMIPAVFMVASVQAEPIDRPVQIVVGFPPGGGMDVTARILASAMQDVYAKNIIVHNRSGAGGRIAADHVKNSSPDGTTILATPSFLFTVYPHSFSKLSYDLKRDFIPVAPFAAIASSVSVGPAVPESVKTFQDYAQWVKQNPQHASYGSGGAGTTQHFAGLKLGRAINAPLQHVAYRGGVPLSQDLMAGVLPMGVQSLPEAAELVKAGRIRSLALTSAQRSPALPDVPTLAELGMKDMILSDSFGIFLPAGTPDAIVQKLSAAIQVAVNKPEMQEALRKMNVDALFQEQAVYAETLRRQSDTWKVEVEASGFKADE